MQYEALRKDLEAKKYAPVYFLQGPETYYIDTIVKYMEDKVVPPQARSFDLTTRYGQETTLEEVIICAKRFPMIAPYQLILIKEAQGLIDLQREARQKALLTYLEAPNPQTLLVFVYKGKSLDQRKHFTKTLEQKAVLFTGKRVYEKALPQWIHTYAKARGYAIDEKASYMLITLVGDDLQALASGLDRIMVNVAAGNDITMAMVREYVSLSKGFDIFDLQQAIQVHDLPRVWKVTSHFMNNKKQYPLIPQLTLLTNFFTKLLRLHHSACSGVGAIAAKLGIPTYFARNYEKALKHYDLKRTQQNLIYLHQADLQVKGIDYPTIPESAILKTLIGKIMHPQTNP